MNLKIKKPHVCRNRHSPKYKILIGPFRCVMIRKLNFLGFISNFFHFILIKMYDTADGVNLRTNHEEMDSLLSEAGDMDGPKEVRSLMK